MTKLYIICVFVYFCISEIFHPVSTDGPKDLLPELLAPKIDRHQASLYISHFQSSTGIIIKLNTISIHKSFYLGMFFGKVQFCGGGNGVVCVCVLLCRAVSHFQSGIDWHHHQAGYHLYLFIFFGGEWIYFQSSIDCHHHQAAISIYKPFSLH